MPTSAPTHGQATRASRPNVPRHRVRDDQFYSLARWRKLRLSWLSRNPLCKRCLDEGISTAAEHVDHIVPRREAPERQYDQTNLQSLCHSCHSRKTNEDMAARRNGGPDPEPDMSPRASSGTRQGTRDGGEG